MFSDIRKFTELIEPNSTATLSPGKGVDMQAQDRWASFIHLAKLSERCGTELIYFVAAIGLTPGPPAMMAMISLPAGIPSPTSAPRKSFALSVMSSSEQC